MDISGAVKTAVSRWKKQYIAEEKGEFIGGKTALDGDKRRIKSLAKQLFAAHVNITVLKKATAFFIRDNPALK
jgi:transposase